MVYHVPRKADGRIDFKPKRHHGFSFFIMVCGWLLPPLAVAIRFGIGKDFFINVFFTICGYFPGHGHNFFLQNIRNNEHRGRTPKWAKRYGLVDDHDAKKQAKKRAWTGRYNEQGTSRQMYDDDGNVYEYDYNHRFEDGDGPSRLRERPNDSDEHFYGQDGTRANGRHDSSSSRTSLSSLRRRNDGAASSMDASSGFGDGPAPGAGDAERRRAKNKSIGRSLLGRGKGKDRHERAEQVMGDGDNYRNPYDDASIDSLDGIGGGRANGRARPPSGYSDDFDGPENADDNMGRRYAARQPRTQTSSSAAPARQPVRDIMDEDHQF